MVKSDLGSNSILSCSIFFMHVRSVPVQFDPAGSDHFLKNSSVPLHFRLQWRNSSVCVMLLYWDKFDPRSVFDFSHYHLEFYSVVALRSLWGYNSLTGFPAATLCILHAENQDTNITVDTV